MNKIQAAIDRVKLAYDALQQRAHGEKLYVAYSGGKDSECIVNVCRAAVGDDAIELNYNCTGIDPPPLTLHVKTQFKTWESEGIECHFNKPKAIMRDLIIKKGPPTRIRRYCCEELKEGGGTGRVVITGVRWAESRKRSESHDVLTVMSKDKELRATYSNDNDIERRIVEHCTTKSRLTINPIIDWSDRYVWQYIQSENINYCRLYDEGWQRIGCIGCPMAGNKRYLEFKLFPYMRKYYVDSFARMLERKPEHYKEKYGWESAEDVFHWWMRDGVIKGQIAMDLQE